MIKKILKEVHKIEPGLVASGVLSSLCGGTASLSVLFLVQISLDCVIGQRFISIYLILTLAGLGISLKFVQSIFKYIFNSKCFPGMLGFCERVATASMVTDYEDLLDPAYLKRASSAQTCVSGSGIGIHQIITSFNELISNIVGSIGAAIVLGQSGMDVILFCIAMILLKSTISLKRKEKYTELQPHLDEQNRKELNWHLLLSDFGSGKDIRVNRCDIWILCKYRALLDKGVRLQEFVNNAGKGYKIFEVVIDVMKDIGVILWVLYLAYCNRISIGIMATSIVSLRMLSTWTEKILTNITDIQGQKKYMDAYFEFTNQKNDERQNIQLPITDYGCEIVFDHVSFTYPGTTKPAVEDFTLTIQAGEKVAFVGLNGAGKTTIISLLCRFYHPDKGRILVNGKDIYDLSDINYYNLISGVFQETSIFSLSIDENISMEPLSVTRNSSEVERLQSAINSVELQNKIPLCDYQKINTTKRFDDCGIGLSRGEECRLALARCIFKNSPIIILDEPTASLDPIGERKVYEMMEKAGRGRTILFVSHRMASTQFCDRIILLDRGKIVGDGTHEQLLRENNVYRSIFETQAKYYEADEDWDS